MLFTLNGDSFVIFVTPDAGVSWLNVSEGEAGGGGAGIWAGSGCTLDPPKSEFGQLVSLIRFFVAEKSM